MEHWCIHALDALNTDIHTFNELHTGKRVLDVLNTVIYALNVLNKY